jgi:Ca-activated chloride channel homolog
MISLLFSGSEFSENFAGGRAFLQFMKRKTAVTTSVVAASAALVAAAILLGNNRGRAAHPRPTPSEPDLAVDCAAGGAPATATADFGHGTFTASLSNGKALRAGGGEMFVSLDLSARDAKDGKRPPLSVAIVLDRSGSMDGEKMEQARQAALAFVERMGADDRIAIVQYDDNAQVLMPSTPTDEAGKAALRAAIHSISTGGSTNLHGGLVLGRDEIQKYLAAGKLNRVILLSDGLANVGVIDSPTIARMASDSAEKGIRITTVGVGLDYNEDLMEAIAEGGRGHYYYVKDATGLDNVLAGELRSLQSTVTTATELRLRPACAGTEILEVYGYDFRREGDAVVVPLADVFGGDKRKVVVKVRVPDRQNGKKDVLAADLKFREVGGGEEKHAAMTLGVEFTDDMHAVDASANKDVIANVLQVESARSMREAADLYNKGDSAGASSVIARQRAKAASTAGRYNVPQAAMAPVYDKLGSADLDIKAAKPAKEFSKKSKLDAREMSK